MREPLNPPVQLPDEPATEALGRAVAAALPQDYGGWSMLLQGELGAGKTTVARAMLRGLGYAGRVPSPTYTLVEPYKFSGGDVYHIDLYRIASAEELEFLGWSDFASGLKLIEWPERIPVLAEEADLKIVLEYDGMGRSARFFGLSDRGTEMAERLVLPALDPVIS